MSPDALTPPVLMVLGVVLIAANLLVDSYSFLLAGLALALAGVVIGGLRTHQARGQHRNGGPHGGSWPW